ncbi:MAG: beta-galactosidase [Candidatus Nealsonbacteria bacterium]
MKKIKLMFLIILIILLIIIGYFFVGSAPERKDITWGVNFSQKHAQNLGLDWKETYLALIDDLGVQEIKIASYWDLLEKEEGKYDFEDLDWQLNTAKDNGVNVFLVIGRKSPRWPECHIPEWAKGLDKLEQQEKILNFLETVVLRYTDSDMISMWQVENEPFFPFGECSWVDDEFLAEEISLVRSLDSKNRPILISDSGEGSFWFSAASHSDIVGTTMYRKVWMSQFSRYLTYPLPPVFYWRKANLIEKFFDKEVICVELQVEPWGPELLYSSPMEEQEKTMNLQIFKDNIEYAKKTGLRSFYLWGGEWWYWMKEVKGQAEIWEEAKKIF